MNDVAAQSFILHEQARSSSNLLGSDVASCNATAIAAELRARYEPPRELTQEISGVMTKLDDPEEAVPLGTGLKPKC
jgi:hypothetical protein